MRQNIRSGVPWTTILATTGTSERWLFDGTEDGRLGQCRLLEGGLKPRPPDSSPRRPAYLELFESFFI
jgi:hypothetical protein